MKKMLSVLGKGLKRRCLLLLRKSLTNIRRELWLALSAITSCLRIRLSQSLIAATFTTRTVPKRWSLATGCAIIVKKNWRFARSAVTIWWRIKSLLSSIAATSTITTASRITSCSGERVVPNATVHSNAHPCWLEKLRKDFWAGLKTNWGKGTKQFCSMPDICDWMKLKYLRNLFYQAWNYN